MHSAKYQLVYIYSSNAWRFNDFKVRAQKNGNLMRTHNRYCLHYQLKKSSFQFHNLCMQYDPNHRCIFPLDSCCKWCWEVGHLHLPLQDM